jgi:hypothetical protein
MKLLNHGQQLGYLVKVETIGQSTNIKCPRVEVTNPPIPLFCRITMNGPLRVWKQLNNLLCLQVAIGITCHGRTLCICCIRWGTIEMVCWVGETSCILTIYLCSIYGDMVGWAQIKAVRPATVFQGQAGNGITENLATEPQIWEGLAATTCLIPCE